MLVHGPHHLRRSHVRHARRPAVSGGWHTADGDDYETFQLNLVLKDRAEPRRPLVEQTELPPLRRNAQLLAEFLNVPLLDQIPQAAG